VDPHPQSPDRSPYNGEVSERTGYSFHPQPRTYAERVALATEVAGMLEGDQTLLVDEMDPEARNNPLWCSYGPAPNSGYLIGRDGTLEAVHSWLSVANMETAIDDLLAR
jgi:hypothetical protein